MEQEWQKFETQFKKLMVACGNDIKKVDSMDSKKKIVIWNSMGLDL